MKLQIDYDRKEITILDVTEVEKLIAKLSAREFEQGWKIVPKIEEKTASPFSIPYTPEFPSPTTTPWTNPQLPWTICDTAGSVTNLDHTVSWTYPNTPYKTYPNTPYEK